MLPLSMDKLLLSNYTIYILNSSICFHGRLYTIKELCLFFSLSVTSTGVPVQASSLARDFPRVICSLTKSFIEGNASLQCTIVEGAVHDQRHPSPFNNCFKLQFCLFCIVLYQKHCLPQPWTGLWGPVATLNFLSEDFMDNFFWGDCNPHPLSRTGNP